METAPLHVLMVDDNDDDAFIMARSLNKAGFELKWWRVDTPEALDNALHLGKWDVVLCDSVMPRLTVLRAVSLVHRTMPRIPVVVVSGHRPEDLEIDPHSDEISGIVCKDHLQDLPAMIYGLLRTESARHGGHC